jgi:hypothetical protein
MAVQCRSPDGTEQSAARGRPPALSSSTEAAARPIPKLARHHPFDRQEATIEVGDVVEADVVAD